MRKQLSLIVFLIAYSLFLTCPSSHADEIRIAAASNFSIALEALIRKYSLKNHKKVLVSSGSTGKHYAQIRNGAPFDIFLAADKARPLLLEKEGHIIKGTRFTYAKGKLALWSLEGNYVDKNGAILKKKDFRHLAIANPKLAPYGTAAEETLTKMGLWNELKPFFVRGENIGQTFQFVKSGNAKLGFIALSQINTCACTQPGSYWLVPQELYTPIEQQAVLLKDSPLGRDFLKFLQSKEGKAIIKAYGYDTSK
ncbi:MAG: molybdate ABC transporter substrate-binding protein [Planctomycetes bacterium]|nr:molybdate ABC transporter substrate-binding protein [Planctomycetota bacterium]